MRGAIVGCRREDGKWLLIRRSAQVWSPLKVCFPGGRIEPGEDPADAARREMREELAAEVELIECVWRHRYRTDVAVELHGWLAALRSERLVAEPSEVEEILWLPPDEIYGRSDALQPGTDLFMKALESAS